MSIPSRIVQPHGDPSLLGAMRCGDYGGAFGVCRARAGMGTLHLGVGRCIHHEQVEGMRDGEDWSLSEFNGDLVSLRYRRLREGRGHGKVHDG